MFEWIKHYAIFVNRGAQELPHLPNSKKHKHYGETWAIHKKH